MTPESRAGLLKSRLMPTHDNKSIDFSKLYKNVSHCLYFVKFRILFKLKRQSGHLMYTIINYNIIIMTGDIMLSSWASNMITLTVHSAPRCIYDY